MSRIEMVPDHLRGRNDNAGGNVSDTAVSIRREYAEAYNPDDPMTYHEWLEAELAAAREAKPEASSDGLQRRADEVYAADRAAEANVEMTKRRFLAKETETDAELLDA